MPFRDSWGKLALGSGPGVSERARDWVRSTSANLTRLVWGQDGSEGDFTPAALEEVGEWRDSCGRTLSSQNMSQTRGLYEGDKAV